MPSGRIALFKMTGSWVSLMIAAATRSSITHCAVEYDGVWYDASESRGDFNKTDVSKHIYRNCYIIERVGITDNFLPQLEGKKYDFAGVGTWLLSRALGRSVAGNENPYCFEAGYFALTGGMPSTAVSGKDLLNLAENHQLAVSYGRFGKLIK